MKERELYMLKHLQRLPRNKQKQYLMLSDDKFIDFLSECAINIINGNVQVQSVKQLSSFEKEMKSLCNKKTSSKVRRKVLQSVKGLRLLKILGKYCESYLS